MTLLAVENLSVSYGDLYAVREVSFALDEHAVFVLLGANGAGKTSILRAISGLVPARGGKITAEGKSMIGLPPHQVARAGISHVPEGRRIFPHLTVEENLLVSFLPGRATATRTDAFASIYQLFPRLAERRRQAGGTLSGGEQQMLAIGRAMMNFPKLLMLDEPSLGLSPVLAELVFERLIEIRRQGTTILLVEQNATCLEMATGGIILANGRVVLAGDRPTLQDSEFVRRAYLGV
jgi:branched-chain amino acid transport system ATP-binding protein